MTRVVARLFHAPRWNGHTAPYVFTTAHGDLVPFRWSGTWERWWIPTPSSDPSPRSGERGRVDHDGDAINVDASGPGEGRSVDTHQVLNGPGSGLSPRPSHPPLDSVGDAILVQPRARPMHTSISTSPADVGDILSCVARKGDEYDGL